MRIAFLQQVSLPPIQLKLIKPFQPARTVQPWTRKGVPPRAPVNYPKTPPEYIIIDGRHRVVYSILSGMSHTFSMVIYS